MRAPARAPDPGAMTAVPAHDHDPDLTARLARALSHFVQESPPRTRVPPLLRIGSPGGPHLGFTDHPGYDPGLRADVLERALDGFEPGVPPPTAWITRGGSLSPGDLDFAWLAAAREAYARHGLPLSAFYLMTADGWTDLLGEGIVTSARVRRRRKGRSPRVHGLVAVHPLAVLEEGQP
jgi:hypothetical protein